jgi:hypothetical protein
MSRLTYSRGQTAVIRASSRTFPRLVLAVALGSLLANAPRLDAQAPGLAMTEQDARTWLGYLASDALQGREVFTEGYGMAATYVAEHLASFGVRPLGDGGTFLQSVTQRTYKVTRRSSVTIDAAGRSQTFRHGEHVSFPLESGGSQTLTFSSFTLVTESRRSGSTAADIVRREDLRGKFVVYLPDQPGSSLRRDAAGEDLDLPTVMVRRLGAAAVMTFIPEPPARRTGRGATVAESGAETSQLTTVVPVETPVPPSITADEQVLDLLFSGGSESFAALRARAGKGEALPSTSMSAFTMTVTVDNSFDVTATQLTANVVGMVEGTDPTLKSTYVIFGAHLDHVGYARGSEAKGKVNTPLAQDRIWNGADDNGSGSVGLLGLARTFAVGPRPRRSVVFIWHAGEEADLIGSRFMVGSPVVPLDRVQAMFNIDMIGRNRDDKASEANTVYVIGADRISTDLHNLLIATNSTLERPMTLDFEFNDPADVESFYTRSDHYSYAAAGIPVAFFFCGTHDDYHANSDTADRILYPKLLRVADLIYRVGFAVADNPGSLERDRLGPRAGRDFSGPLPKSAR